MKNYGFIQSKIESDNYVLGDDLLQSSILMSDGHGWGNYLPKDELQNKNGLETMNCTVYGTLNCLETIGRAKGYKGFQSDLSERYGGIMTRTMPTGNNPHKVIEIIRSVAGAVPEVFLPFDSKIDTWDKYYSPKPISYWLFKVGTHWLKKYKVGHDWVFLPENTKENKIAKMKFALQYSPLGASVFAWSRHDDGLYYSDAPVQNHWVMVYDYVEGKKWLVYDSYNNTHKELDWNFDFGQCKRYSLDLNQGFVGSIEDEEIKIPEARLQYAMYLIRYYLGL